MNVISSNGLRKIFTLLKNKIDQNTPIFDYNGDWFVCQCIIGWGTVVAIPRPRTDMNLSVSKAEIFITNNGSNTGTWKGLKVKTISVLGSLWYVNFESEYTDFSIDPGLYIVRITGSIRY